MVTTNTPFSRPWLRTFIPAGAILVFLIFVFVSQYHDGIALPRPHGITTSPTGHKTSEKTKAVVTSVQKEDETTADWLAEFLPDWQAVVYVTDRTSDDPVSSNTSLISPHHLPVNKGREASVYLTYIIQHYHSLPEYVVFIHGKRYQIHNDDPRLNLDHVDKEGYASLRCNWMHCPEAQVKPVLGHEDDFWGITGLYASAWTQFFPKDPVPDVVAGPCCAQFAVSRGAIRRLPIDKYEQIRQWIWTLEVPAEQASMKSGLVLEYMWHIIFGKPAYYCPPAKECYCEKWDMCDLRCEREGWCLGRIWHNPLKNPIFGLSKPIPDGWPVEGQSTIGKDGYFPYQGWEKNPEEIIFH
ncbi:hypothetical protein MBLNU13_g00318t1 [Cladosporium sp. NU13]